MRYTILLALAAVACSTKDAPVTDSSAASIAPPAAPAKLTAADVAGTWNGMTMRGPTDSVVNHWVSTRTSDSTGTLTAESTADTIMYSVVYDADSMIATSKPFSTKADPKTKVMFVSVGRLKDGKLVGTTTTKLAAKPDSVLARDKWEATRKP